MGLVQFFFNSSSNNRYIGMAIEVWTDVLGFIKRIQLARTVSLTNWRIHEICWPRLHGNKVEPYEIGEFTITCQGRFDQYGPPMKALLLKDDMGLPIACCPPPDYITGFREINIK
jgi:hypothetical protein